MNRIYPLLLFCLFLILLGCQEPEKGPEAASFKRTGNDVIVRIEAEPDRLNPITTTSQYSFDITEQIFNFLVVPDIETFEMIPQLVKTRPVLEEITEGPYKGGTKYTFEFHEEAVWDDGKPVTAEDYIFTVKATLNPKVPADIFRAYFSSLKDVQADPENPKKFSAIIYPNYINAEGALGNNISPLPAHIYDPEGLMAPFSVAELADPEKAEKLAESNPNLQAFADQFLSPKFNREVGGISGCGPYRFESWENGQEIVLVKKENWWGDALADKFPALAAYPERILYKIIPNSTTAITALKAEEIDILNNIDVKGFLELKESEEVNSIFELETPISLACYYIYVNNENIKLNDKRVRKAIAHGIDIEELLKNLYSGFGERVNAPLIPTSSSYNKDLPPVPYNPEQSKQLLEEAGWTDSNGNGIVDKEIDGELIELSITYYHSSREISRNSGLLFKDLLSQVGIELVLEETEFSNLLGKLRQGDYELAAGGTTVQFTPWEPKQRWHSSSANGGSNYQRFINDEADQLIDEIQSTFDENKRDQLYHKLQEIMYDEQPLIFMIIPTGRLAIHKRFETTITAISPGYSVNFLKLKEPR